MKKIITTEYALESEYSSIRLRRAGQRILIKQTTPNDSKEIYIYKNDILELEACFRKLLEEDETN